MFVCLLQFDFLSCILCYSREPKLFNPTLYPVSNQRSHVLWLVADWLATHVSATLRLSVDHAAGRVLCPQLQQVRLGSANDHRQARFADGTAAAHSRSGHQARVRCPVDEHEHGCQ